MFKQLIYKESRALICCVFLWLSIVGVYSIQSEILPSCSPSEEICRVTFTLGQIETMVLYENGVGIPIVYRDGGFKKRLSCFQFEDATPEELEQVNMADGQYKFVYGINNQVPGPTIVVYENQTLEVTVTNLQMHEGAGIHWHGIFQVGSPFMDGVPGVTQCAIHPMETFVYRFQPSPRGTHFYHSHMGVQRTDGVYGGLIVLSTEMDDTLPQFAQEFLMLFHDWYPDTNIQDLYAYQYGLTTYRMFGYNSSTCESYEPSTIINGRGYHYESGEPVMPIPLTTYTVQQGQYYRFRLINSALETAYKVHIDQHKLFVIASDGSDITPVEADYVVVHTGERYDVYIEANQPVDNYWVRVEFVDYPDQPGLAILRYEGAAEVLPTSSHTECTDLDPCELVNCPFEAFSDTSLNFVCINIGDITSTGNLNYFPLPKLVGDKDNKLQELEEHFYAFQIAPDTSGNFKFAVNAVHYIPPSKPPQIHSEIDFDNDCSQFDCINEPCTCTHMETVTIGNTIQMVFVGSDGLHGHPIHMHGHRFQVMKVAYGVGFGIHPEIICNSADESRCTSPTWADPSWSGGNVPGLNEENPPEKDTVIVPRGGYVVVRYFASNAGWWLLHCHMDFHFATGMGIIIQEGEIAEMPPVPSGIGTCGSFRYDSGYTSADTYKAEDTPEKASEDDLDPKSCYPQRPVIGYVMSFVSGFMLAACIFLIAMAFCQKKTIILQPEPEKY